MKKENTLFLMLSFIFINSMKFINKYKIEKEKKIGKLIQLISIK